METEPSLWARIWDFGLAFIPYWWAILTGGFVALVWEMIRSQKERLRFLRWLVDRDKRHWISYTVIMLGVLWASFQAFDDEAKRLRDAEAKNNRPDLQAQVNLLTRNLNAITNQLQSENRDIFLTPDRRLTPDDIEKIKNAFAPIAKSFSTLWVYGSSDTKGEAMRFAAKFVKTFRDAGINAIGPIPGYPSAENQTGLMIGMKDIKNIPDDAALFMTTMDKVGFTVTPVEWGTDDTNNPGIDFDLFIGPKP